MGTHSNICVNRYNKKFCVFEYSVKKCSCCIPTGTFISKAFHTTDDNQRAEESTNGLGLK